METDSGYKIENFTTLATPKDRGNLKALIYSGNVLLPDGKIEVFWNEDGMCSNIKRNDCFITNFMSH